ncbi:MAG TPA: hypothetical protein VF790_03970 [Dissulfurispiraceae bacterium]
MKKGGQEGFYEYNLILSEALNYSLALQGMIIRGGETMKKTLGVLCVLLLVVIGPGFAHANVLDFPVGSSFWVDKNSSFDFGGFHFSGYGGIDR